MYHPAAALRQASLKQTLFTDMQGVPTALTEARALRVADQARGDPTAASALAQSPVAPEFPAVRSDPEPATDTTADAGVESDPTAQLGLF
jgi:hypothetical protein